MKVHLYGWNAYWSSRGCTWSCGGGMDEGIVRTWSFVPWGGSVGFLAASVIEEVVYRWTEEWVALEVVIIDRSDGKCDGWEFESECRRSDHKMDICALIEWDIDFYKKRFSLIKRSLILENSRNEN